MKRAAAKDTVAVRKKTQKVINDKFESQFGIIESVSLQNFMCHDNLKIQLGPHVNFIIGLNGSGKSAILTGIMLALGGRSSLTGRFSKCQDFVKKGKQKAKIEVVLRNSGSFPYKPELFGEKITVIREISASGKPSYKLKAESGQVVSTQKEALINILDQMDIQIDNPVTVLTQECSRNFLMSKTGSPSNLFQLFYKGTGLQALSDNYDQIQLMKDEAAEELERKRQAFPEKEKELKSWQKFLNSSAKIADYKKELLWAGVIEMEKILQEKSEEFTNCTKEIHENKIALEKCKMVFADRSKNLIEFTKQRHESDKSMNTHREAMEELQAQRESCSTTLRKLEGSLALYKREERKLADDIQNSENCINENQQKSQNDINEEKKRREYELTKLVAEQKRRETAKKIKEDMRCLKLEELSSLQRKMDILISECANIDYERKKLESENQRCRNAMHNKVNVFGEQTQNVLNEINRRRREFLHLPIGPIGAELDVKASKWSPAIEHCLKRNTLRSFCCDNHNDAGLLKDILKKYYHNFIPSIIVSKFLPRMHDVSVHKAQTIYPTVLDMLRIKNPVVANCLIDQISIENCILIEDPVAARRLMMNNPPKNCYRAFLLNCDEICLNPYRYYSYHKPNQKCILTSLNQDDIKDVEGRLQSISTAASRKKNELFQLQQQAKHVQQQELKQLEKEIVQLYVLEKNISDKIKDVEHVDESRDVFLTEGDLLELRNEHEKKRIEIENCNSEVVKCREELRKINEDMESRKTLLRSEMQKFDDLGSKINNCMQMKETLASRKKKYESEIKVGENQCKLLQKDVDEVNKATEIAVKNAEGICNRIETERSPETIRRLLTETEKVIEKQSNCNQVELRKKYIEKLEKIKNAKAELNRMENTVARIDSMWELRRKKFLDIRTYTEAFLRKGFHHIITGNGYRGTITIDFPKETLTLNVIPRKEERGGRKNSTLSGGERSYVTIALLIALWDRSHSPFVILDEYDVFMDSNNRALSIDLLITQAEHMLDTQFLFLSPLDLPKIKPSEYIRIHRLLPPERIE